MPRPAPSAVLQRLRAEHEALITRPNRVDRTGATDSSSATKTQSSLRLTRPSTGAMTSTLRPIPI